MNASAETKACRKCGRTLPLEEFPWSTTVCCGKKYRYRTSPCRQCRSFAVGQWKSKKAKSKRYQKRQNAYMRDWRKKNPGYKGRKTRRVYNAEKQKEYRDRYLSKPGNAQKSQEYNRQYYLANRERILAKKKAKKHETH